MMNFRALSKIVLTLIIIVVIIIAGVGIYLLTIPPSTTTTASTTIPTTSTATTTSTITTMTSTATTSTTTTTQTKPSLEIVPNVVITVPNDLYNFALKAKNNQISVEIEFGVAMTDAEINAIQKQINSFEQQYPGVKVTLHNYPDLRAAVQASLQVNQGPTVFTWAHDWIGSFADKYIIPIDQYVDSSVSSKYYESAYTAGVYKGHVYGLPYAAETVALVYNKAFITNPPKTFDQMQQIMKNWMSSKGPGYYGISYQIDPYFVSAWVHAFGGYYYNDTTGLVGINSTGTKNGISFILNNFKPYMSSADVGHDAQLGLFVSGMTPMIITGPWDIGKIKSSKIDFGVAPLPSIVLSNSTILIPKPYSGVRLMYLSKLAQNQGTDKVLAGVLFILWFTLNPAVAKGLAQDIGYIPILNALVNDPDLKQIPQIFGYQEQLNHSIPMPKSPQMSAVWDALGTAIPAIWSGQPINDVLNAAQAQAIQSIIQQYGGYPFATTTTKSGY